MDTTLYKKRSLKFNNNAVSRDSRHAETQKARESSRFKRLSLLRSLDEETNNESKREIIKQEEKKKPPSRLEMLMKWKQEKKIKKELDKKNKPFYVGGKSNYNMGFSSVTQSNMNFNSSKLAKSRLIPPSSTQSVKVMNTTKQVPPRSTQSAKIQTSSTSFQSSRIPNNYKQNEVKAVSETKAKIGSSKNSKAFGNSVVSNVKQNGVKAVSETKAKTVPSKNSKTFGNTVVSNVKQVSALPKPNFSKQLNKAVKTGIPTISSNLSRGIATQTKNKNTVMTYASKPQEKVIPRLVENVSNKKKEFGLKIAPIKQAGEKKGTSKTGLERIEEEKKNDIKIHEEELLPEQDLKKDSSIFECSVSMIKQGPSFAPANFKFIPPVGLPDFAATDELMKTNFISRTSTPSKPCQEPSSPVVEVACNDPPLTDNLTPLPKILISESPVTVKLPGAKEDKVHLPSEEKSEIDKSFNENKIKALLADYQKYLDDEAKPAKVSEDSDIDSSLSIVDLPDIDGPCTEPVESVKQDDGPISDSLFSQQNQDKYTEKKLSTAPTERTSMLKSVPVLNSIAEIAEPDEHISDTPKIEHSSVTTRRSQRLSKIANQEKNSDGSCGATPRRSLRLQNIIARKCLLEESETFSPKSKSDVRRSVRLIDLNTPKKELTDSIGKTNITTDFQRLCLTEPENINPHACLLDFECSPVPKLRSKKVSLLYSPEKKRNSIRKSIKGDLMSFSPNN